MVLVELLSSFVIDVISKTGYLGIFFLMTLESAMLPPPSEVVMAFSGFLVATGQFNFFYVVAASTLGNLLGSVIIYFIGATVGREVVIKYGKYVFVDEGHIDWADRWFKRFGEKIIFLGRNLPVVRTYISLPAGITKMNFSKFVSYTIVGSITWNAALTYIGFLMGKNWDRILNYTTIIDAAIILSLVVLIVWWLRKRFR